LGLKSRSSRLLFVLPIAAALALAGVVGVALTPKGPITARGAVY